MNNNNNIYIKPWVIALTDGNEELRSHYPDNIMWTARNAEEFIEGIEWVEAVDDKGAIILDISEKFDYVLAWLKETNRDKGRFHIVARTVEYL